MNFLNFLTAGASLFNCNLQNLTSSSSSQFLQNTTPTKINQTLPQIPLTSELNLKMKHQMEVLSQQQQLINQYMHLNIQLLSQKLENLEKIPIEDKTKISATKEDANSQQQKNNHKKNKKINKCGHDDKQHYAKGLCNNCYHKYGRTKKPWNCPHQKLYAAGMCQNCYINNYNKKKRLNRDNGQTEQFENQLKMEESMEIVAEDGCERVERDEQDNQIKEDKLEKLEKSEKSEKEDKQKKEVNVVAIDQNQDKSSGSLSG